MPDSAAGILTYVAGAGGLGSLVLSLGTLYLQHSQQVVQSEDGINKLVDKKTQDLITRYDADIQALRDQTGKLQTVLDTERKARMAAEDETRALRQKRAEETEQVRQDTQRLVAETRALCVTRAEQADQATRELHRRLAEMEQHYQDCRERLERLTGDGT